MKVRDENSQVLAIWVNFDGNPSYPTLNDVEYLLGVIPKIWVDGLQTAISRIGEVIKGVFFGPLDLDSWRRDKFLDFLTQNDLNNSKETRRNSFRIL